MADEQVTKPRAPRKKKAAAASKTSAKKPAAKKPAAKKAAIKKATVRKTVKATAKAPKSTTGSTTEPTTEPIMESQTMNQESTNDNADRETFTKDPHLEPTGTLADKIWRLIAMTAFAMIAYFAVLGVIVLAAVQFVVVVLDDKPSAEVGGYMSRVNNFLQEIVAFLSFSSNDMPFPFKPFPGSDDT